MARNRQYELGVIIEGQGAPHDIEFGDSHFIYVLSGASQFVAGQKIRVTGTTNNNGTFTVQQIIGDTIIRVVESVTTESLTSAVIDQDPDDPETWTPVNTDAFGAAAEKNGSAVVFLAELLFDSTVTSSRIEWAVTLGARPPIIQVSIDDGRTWQSAWFSGQEIPGIGPGVNLHNINLLVRQILPVPQGEAASSIDWIEVEINFDTGEQIFRREDSSDDWGQGRLVGTVVRNGRLEVAPLTALRNRGPAGGIVEVIDSAPEITNPDSVPHKPLHVSHGVVQTFGGIAVVVPDPESLTPRRDVSFSIECWVYVEDASASDQVLAMWLDANTGRDGLKLEINERSIIATFARQEFLPDLSVFSRPVLLDDNAWYHIAVVYDGFWASIMVDGQQVSRASMIPLVIPNTTGPLYLLAHPKNNLQFFRGWIAELRIWDRYLTSGEIFARMRRSLSVAEVVKFKADGLVAYFPMVGSGDTPTDAPELIYDNTGKISQPAGAADVRLTFEPAPPTWRGLRGDEIAWPDGQPALPNRIAYRVSPGLPVAVYGNALRLNTGPFSIRYGGQTYIGVGGLANIGEIEESSQLESVGLQLTLSGIQLAHVSLAMGQNYTDRPARVWQAVYGADGLMVGDPILLFAGRMDTMPITLGETATVGVTVENRLTDWERPRVRRLSDEVQKSLFPTDKGLDLIAATSQKTIWWPTRFAEGG